MSSQAEEGGFTLIRVAGQGRGSGPRLFTLTPIAALRVGFVMFDNAILRDGGFRNATGGEGGLLDVVFNRRQRNLPRSSIVATDGITLIVHYDKVGGGGVGLGCAASAACTGVPFTQRLTPLLPTLCRLTKSSHAPSAVEVSLTRGRVLLGRTS